MGAVGMLLLGLIRTLITVWELATNWAYSLLTSPGQKLQDYSRVLSAPQEEIKENDTEVVNKFFICAQILHFKLLAGHLHTESGTQDTADFRV